MIPEGSRYQFRRITQDDLALMRQLLALYSDVFDDPSSYASNPPSDAYLSQLLSKSHFIAIVAMNGQDVVGGLCAYVLEKFEQDRSEIYIYDLAVKLDHRRKGIATGLIRELQGLAKDHQAWVIYVQADHGDEPAIQLYESLGAREEVLHFDIPVLRATR